MYEKDLFMPKLCMPSASFAQAKHARRYVLRGCMICLIQCYHYCCITVLYLYSMFNIVQSLNCYELHVLNLFATVCIHHCSTEQFRISWDFLNFLKYFHKTNHFIYFMQIYYISMHFTTNCKEKNFFECF